MKYHKIHSDWRLSFRKGFLRRLGEARQVQWLFWRDSFTFSETVIHGPDHIHAELARFVQTVHPYPRWLLAADQVWRTSASLAHRVLAKARILP